MRTHIEVLVHHRFPRCGLSHLQGRNTGACNSECNACKEARVVSNGTSSQHTLDALTIQGTLLLWWQLYSLAAIAKCAVTAVLLAVRQLHSKVLSKGLCKAFVSRDEVYNFLGPVKRVLLLLLQVGIHLLGEVVELLLGLGQLLEDSEFRCNSLGSKLNGPITIQVVQDLYDIGTKETSLARDFVYIKVGVFNFLVRVIHDGFGFRAIRLLHIVHYLMVETGINNLELVLIVFRGDGSNQVVMQLEGGIYNTKWAGLDVEFLHLFVQVLLESLMGTKLGNFGVENVANKLSERFIGWKVTSCKVLSDIEIGVAEIQYAIAGFPIPTSAANLLTVLFNCGWNCVVDDTAYVGLVDTHTERDCGNYNLHPVRHEVVLCLGFLFDFHPCMKSCGIESF